MSPTHTFYPMCAYHHREPGILGVVLERADLYADLICDGLHVSPEACCSRSGFRHCEQHAKEKRCAQIRSTRRRREGRELKCHSRQASMEEVERIGGVINEVDFALQRP